MVYNWIITLWQAVAHSNYASYEANLAGPGSDVNICNAH